MDTVDKVIEINELFAKYYTLLTPKQQLIMRYYYQDDYSLGEIAELESISRNAVHDQIKRTVKKLYDFEAKLHMNKRAKKRLLLLHNLKQKNTDEALEPLIEELKKVE